MKSKTADVSHLLIISLVLATKRVNFNIHNNTSGSLKKRIWDDSSDDVDDQLRQRERSFQEKIQAIKEYHSSQIPREARIK